MGTEEIEGCTDHMVPLPTTPDPSTDHRTAPLLPGPTLNLLLLVLTTSIPAMVHTTSRPHLDTTTRGPNPHAPSITTTSSPNPTNSTTIDDTPLITMNRMITMRITTMPTTTTSKDTTETRIPIPT